MRHFALILIASFLLIMPALAQNGYPLPPNLPPITPGNAAQLTKLASIGGTLPGGLAWSPDGEHLAVGTSENVQIFDSTHLDAQPFIISEPDIYQNYYFDSQGHLVVPKDNGQDKWDLQTGQLIPPTQSQSTPMLPAVHHYVSSDGSIEAIPDFQHGQIIIHLIDLRMTPAKKLDDLNTGLDADFSDMTFSPNGRKLVIQANRHTPDSDIYRAPTIQLWDISSRTLIKKWPIPYSEIDELAFSADSHLLGVVESDGTWDSEVNDGELQIWNTATGELFDRMDIYEPSDYVRTPNGRFAVRHNEDMVLWTGQEFIHLPASSVCPGESENKALLRFSPSGNSLVTAVNCGDQIQVWDVTGKIAPSQPSVVLDSDNLITWVVFSPDEKRVVMNEKNFVARVWDAQSGATLFDVEGEAQGVSFSMDGTLLGGFDGNGNRVLWDGSTGKTIITLPADIHLNADWSQAAYWLDATNVRVIETASGKSADLKILDDYAGNLSAFNGDAGKVFFTGDDVRGYDLQSGVVSIQRPNTTEFSHIVFSPGGKYFLSQYMAESDIIGFDVWESEHSTQPIHHFRIPEILGNSYTLSANGKFLSELGRACGADFGGVYRLWDTTTGENRLSWHERDCGPTAYAFTPDGKWLLVSWYFKVGIIKLSDAIAQAVANKDHIVDDPAPIALNALMPYDEVRQMTFSRNGDLLAVTVATGTIESSIPYEYAVIVFNWNDLISRDQDVNIWDEDNTIILNSQRATFSPNNQYLLTENGLYDMQTGDLLASVNSTTAAFSPDGATLITAGEDSLQIWDVAALANGEAAPLATFAMQSVQEVAFNPDSTTLYIQGVNDVQVWGIPPVS